jgi:hypothetical protein
MMFESATLSKQFAGHFPTTPRYTDFEKVSGKPLILTEQGNVFPTPYSTLPMGEMNARSDGGKPWDRPLPMPSGSGSTSSGGKKEHFNIYDNPQ